VLSSCGRNLRLNARSRTRRCQIRAGDAPPSYEEPLPPTPSTGSGQGRPFAGLNGTTRLSDSCPALGLSSLGSLWAYRCWRPHLRSAWRGRSPGGTSCPAAPCRPTEVTEQDRSPRFLGNPPAAMPGSSTPAGPTRQASAACQRGPRHANGEACTRRNARFRDSLTWPDCSLSTLRPDGPTPGRKTRFRLLAKLCRVGLLTHRVPTKGFQCISYIRPPFPGLPWRNCIVALSPAALQCMQWCATMQRHLL
jgi:hypothetical protein